MITRTLRPALVFLALSALAVRGQEQEKFARIPELLKKAVEKKQIAGGATLIARHGKIVHQAAVGHQDVEGKVALTESTIFRIASMSKPITSAAVMVLVDDGKVSVTDPLSKFVPEFKDMKVLVPAADGRSHEFVKANREITIHDLLTHTSGITYRLINKPILAKMYADAGVSDGLVETPGTIGDNVRKIAKLPLACQPGAAWEYGLNTDVLGYVVEVASGKPLEQFCKERLFQPLKMMDTGFYLPKDKWPRLSALYSLGAGPAIQRVGDKPVTLGTLTYSATFPMHEDGKYYSGGGGMVSTVGDYFRFSQMMLNRGELDGVRVLKAETVDRMTRNQMGDLRIQFPGFDLMGYGFGILSETGKEATKEAPAVGSYSWAGAFGTFFWIDPKNEVIGVLMMQVFPPDFAIAGEFKRLAYEAVGETKK
jgi:CubicO group peptidase (beta-lactamase class C family)